MSKAVIALGILFVIFACGFISLMFPPGLSEAQVEQTKIALIQQQLSGKQTATAQADFKMATATADIRTATAQAWQSTAEAARQATAAQRIVDRQNAQATADAAQATAQYLNAQATASAETLFREQTAAAAIHQAQSTETAIAQRKTEAAYADQQTAQAQATATERAWSLTRTAQSIQNTQTAQVVHSTATRQADLAAIQRTAEAVQVESMNLALERERTTNLISALAPWAIGITLIVVLLFILWRWSKVQQIGKVLVFDGRLAYDPARNPLPWMRVLAGGQVEAPLLAPPQMQADTTRRDQAIEALRVLPPGSPQRPPRQVFNSQLEPNPPVPEIHIEVLDAQHAEVRPWLEEVNSKYFPESEA